MYTHFLATLGLARSYMVSSEMPSACEKSFIETDETSKLENHGIFGSQYASILRVCLTYRHFMSDEN